MTLHKVFEISTGHRLPNHKSKCFNFHGHNYMVEVEITFAYRSDEYIQNDDGFFIDFGDIKSVINDTFDHRFLMYSGDKYLETMKDFPGVVIVDYMPTAENMAVHMRGLIIDKLESVYKEYAVIVNVKLSETVSSKVIL